VPVLCLADSPTGPSTLDDPHHLVVRSLGTRSGWTTKKGAQVLHPLACHHRQVYKVDRSSIDFHDQIRVGRTVLPRHRPSLRCSELHHHGQQHAVHWQEIPLIYDEHHIRVNWASVAHPERMSR
jgi:hypothetical protein